MLRAIASGVLNNMLKFEINRMNSFFYLRRTEKSDFEKNEFKVLGMYIFAYSWGRPTARYLLKQALEPEILWISLQKFNSMFLKNYTFEIWKKKKNRFFENSKPPSPLNKNSHWNQKRVWWSSWIRIKLKWTIISEINHSLVDKNDLPINLCILLWQYHLVNLIRALA